MAETRRNEFKPPLLLLPLCVGKQKSLMSSTLCVVIRNTDFLPVSHVCNVHLIIAMRHSNPFRFLIPLLGKTLDTFFFSSAFLSILA